MKVLKMIGETILFFCIMLIILTIAKQTLGFDHPILPHAFGSAIGWVIGYRIIGYIFRKNK